MQTCLCDSPGTPGKIRQGPQARGWQRRRGAGPGACRRRSAHAPRPVPSAPTDPAAASRAGERVSAKQARTLGSASRAHSASTPYLPAAPSSPARKFRTTPSPGARTAIAGQAWRQPAPPEHRLFRLQSCQLRGADAGVGGLCAVAVSAAGSCAPSAGRGQRCRRRHQPYPKA